MLESITLKFTEDPKTLKIPTKGITVFVGPNNSGKSLTLREVEEQFRSDRKLTNLKILEEIAISWPDNSQIDRDIEIFGKNAPPGLPEGYVYFKKVTPGGVDEIRIPINDLRSFAAKKQEQFWVASKYMRLWLTRLDGRTRFELSNDRQTGDLTEHPQNVLASLFTDDNLRTKIRNMIHEAFGVYLVVDPTAGGSLRIRLSEIEPGNDEKSLSRDAINFHKNATYIRATSDGVQAYVGMIIAVYGGDYRAVLVDEPEAFLHPPLARKLGSQLSAIAAERKGSLIAATHSSDFVIGCVQTSTDVRIVRLEYSGGKSRARMIDPNLLQMMYRDPLLRSANVISSLFYDGVVIGESDNDRSFYGEVYHRLADQEKGYPSILFLNAQNKQTAKRIMRPLRQIGIPAVAVLDIDVLKDGGSEWTGWLSAAQVPEALHDGLGVQRGTIKAKFEASGRDMKRDGIDALNESDRRAAGELLDMLASYGVFVVRRGELESWLPELGAVGKKTDWTISVLEKMGIDRDAASYLAPGGGDVWDFVRGIVGWVKDPGRKGTS